MIFPSAGFPPFTIQVHGIGTHLSCRVGQGPTLRILRTRHSQYLLSAVGVQHSDPRQHLLHAGMHRSGDCERSRRSRTARRGLTAPQVSRRLEKITNRVTRPPGPGGLSRGAGGLPRRLRLLAMSLKGHRFRSPGI